MSYIDRSRGEGAGAERAPRLGAPFISVAFVTALLFAPLVVATGLLTSRKPVPPAAPPEVSLAARRPSLDGTPSLRHAKPELR